MTIVELRRIGTPVAYITLPVRYDAWGDPYVKTTIFDELFRGGMDFIGGCALRPDGGTDSRRREWKLISGPPVRFPGNVESRGWKPA